MGGKFCSDNWVIGKETENQTRQRVGEDLRDSAEKYADYAENTILKLQQAYLKKYHRLEHAKSEEGIANIIRGFQLDFLNWFSELVSEDDCRKAVGLLNTLRLKRAENLEDGYNVSVIQC